MTHTKKIHFLKMAGIFVSDTFLLNMSYEGLFSFINHNLFYFWFKVPDRFDVYFPVSLLCNLISPALVVRKLGVQLDSVFVFTCHVLSLEFYTWSLVNIAHVQTKPSL